MHQWSQLYFNCVKNVKNRLSNFDSTLVNKSVIVAICCGGCYKVTFMGACVVGMVFVTC